MNLLRTNHSVVARASGAALFFSTIYSTLDAAM